MVSARKRVLKKKQRMARYLSEQRRIATTHQLVDQIIRDLETKNEKNIEMLRQMQEVCDRVDDKESLEKLSKIVAKNYNKLLGDEFDLNDYLLCESLNPSFQYHLQGKESALDEPLSLHVPLVRTSSSKRKRNKKSSVMPPSYEKDPPLDYLTISSPYPTIQGQSFAEFNNKSSNSLPRN